MQRRSPCAKRKNKLSKAMQNRGEAGCRAHVQYSPGTLGSLHPSATFPKLYDFNVFTAVRHLLNSDAAKKKIKTQTTKKSRKRVKRVDFSRQKKTYFRSEEKRLWSSVRALFDFSLEEGYHFPQSRRRNFVFEANGIAGHAGCKRYASRQRSSSLRRSWLVMLGEKRLCPS